MITFGLTGSICCGKSTITKTIQSLDVPMVDADLVARQVIVPGTEGLSQIINYFGHSYLQQDGTLDRAALAALVFRDQESMDALNQIMAPLINEESGAQIRKLHSQGHGIVGFDGALIIEMGNANKYRPLIVVTCPREMQIERMMKRNNFTMEHAIARINSQMSSEEKVKLADYVIDSSGSIEESIAQTKKIIQEFKKLNV